MNYQDKPEITPKTVRHNYSKYNKYFMWYKDLKSIKQCLCKSDTTLKKNLQT